MTLRDSFWAMKDERDQIVPAQADSRLRDIPLLRFPFRKLCEVSLSPISYLLPPHYVCLHTFFSGNSDLLRSHAVYSAVPESQDGVLEHYCRLWVAFHSGPDSNIPHLGPIP